MRKIYYLILLVSILSCMPSSCRPQSINFTPTSSSTKTSISPKAAFTTTTVIPATTTVVPLTPTLKPEIPTLSPTIPRPSIPDAPAIVEFDMKKGYVKGAACAGCRVDVFSCSIERGIIEDRMVLGSTTTDRKLEGSIIADQYGEYMFEKGQSFIGPNLTVSTKDPSGKFSDYSTPTFGSRMANRFQVGNGNPFSVLPLNPAEKLMFNKLGDNQYIGRGVAYRWSGIYQNIVDYLGLKWTRTSVVSGDWPDVRGNYTEYKITPGQDRGIELLYANNTKIYLSLNYWDPELENSLSTSRFRSEREVERFLDYTRFITNYFKGKIEWYGILNEPNSHFIPKQYVKVEDYINLIKRVVPVIRQVNPQSKVVVGDVSSFRVKGSYNYLKKILNSDVMSMVDGIAWHGTSFLSPDYLPGLYQDYPGMIQEIVKTAKEHGFQGQFFATELHWRTPYSTLPGDIEGIYSEIVSGKYLARGIVFHLDKGFMISTGWEGYTRVPPVVQVIRSLANIMAGTEPAELTLRVDSTATNIKTVAFVLPNGDRLISVWTDDKAVDNDPGVVSTITITGASAAHVLAIDPLYGFQQVLNVFSENGDLVINNFLVKDYPIMILLERYAPAS
jgi:hypothetical protein